MSNIDPYNPISLTSSATAAATPKANNTLDKEAFLKLLVAQLKYQSPDKPVDSSQFMTQTAQLSSMEALQEMAKSQAQLLSSQQSAMATGMIGGMITFADKNGGADLTGMVSGIKLGANGPILKVGDMEVPISSVKEVNRAS